MLQRRGGTIQVAVDAELLEAKGSWTFGLGVPKRKVLTGPDGEIQGFTEELQVGFIEGTITDRRNLNLTALMNARGLMVALLLANGKTIILSNAVYCGEGTGTTEEGEVDVRFEGRATERM